MTLCDENKEGYPAFNIDPDAWKNRKPGLSAFVRLANEEEWVGAALRSILPWCDEIVCTLQCSTDGTEKELRSIESDKIWVYHYPFQAWPNGPGHDKQPLDSVHNNAYFYNWSMSLTHCEWVVKWDGDMVAMDWLPGAFQRLVDKGADVIRLRGTNLVSDLAHMSKDQPFIEEGEPRFFRLVPGVYYGNGSCSEKLTFPSSWKMTTVESPSYLHFKWAKESRYQGWPENWEENSHFKRIAKRAELGEPYNGEVPEVLRGVMP